MRIPFSASKPETSPRLYPSALKMGAAAAALGLTFGICLWLSLQGQRAWLMAAVSAH